MLFVEEQVFIGENEIRNNFADIVNKDRSSINDPVEKLIN